MVWCGTVSEVVRIVAIGGGELPRFDRSSDTTELDAEVVRLAGVRAPRMVFLPTGHGDDAGYINLIREHYGGRLGCRVQPLPLYDRSQTSRDIEHAIRRADIVYVGGGNTLRMMKLWRRRGVDRLLVSAGAGGAVLAGISAGAICWCTAGVSDSRAFSARDDAWDYIAVRGIGLVDVVLAPHCNADARRRDALRRIAHERHRVGVGLDDFAALEILDDRYRILSCAAGVVAHRIDRSGRESPLEPHDHLRPLTDLSCDIGGCGRGVPS